MNSGPVNPLSSLWPERATGKLTKAEGPSFKETLSSFIQEVNGLQQGAEDSIRKLATGEVKNLHQVMIAAGEADVAFRFMMEVRNKLMEAYREVMRMQV